MHQFFTHRLMWLARWWSRRKAAAEMSHGAIAHDLRQAVGLLQGHSSTVQVSSAVERARCYAAAKAAVQQVTRVPTLASAANDLITVQTCEMFQALADLDAGVTPLAAAAPTQAPHTAADQAAPSPSLATSPLPSMQDTLRDMESQGTAMLSGRIRAALAERLGFCTWVGPSQTPAELTPDDACIPGAGLFLQGHARAGSVVAIIPGAVYNSEMRQRAADFGHVGNPAVTRMWVPRYDDALIDVWGAASEHENPYAMGQLAKPPPPGAAPNVMRVPWDVVDPAHNAHDALAFPLHLRPYVPNEWGAPVNLGQTMHSSAFDAHIWMKSVVLVATRDVLDEELFVQYQFNPVHPALPAQGTPSPELPSGEAAAPQLPAGEQAERSTGERH